MSPIFYVLSYVFGIFHMSTWNILIGLVHWNASGSGTDLDHPSEVHPLEQSKVWDSDEGDSELVYQSEVGQRCSVEGTLMKGLRRGRLWLMSSWTHGPLIFLYGTDVAGVCHMSHPF
jgi:hypothetical protein